MQYTMLGNIIDQGRALRECFKKQEAYIPELIEFLGQKPLQKVYVLGSGSSYHAAVVIKYYIQELLKVETQFMMPNLFTYHEETALNGINSENILVIGITQSGNSTSTLEALKKAESLGHTVLGVTENRDSKMAEEAYHILYLLCGKEHVPPETRGYTVTLLMMYLLFLRLAEKLGRISERVLYEKLKEAERFVAAFDDYITESLDWFEKNKEELCRAEKFGVTGYGMNYGTAIEAQLKLYECTHLPAVGYEAEEFIHGHVFAYGADNYILAVGSSGPELKRMNRVNGFYREKVTEHVFTITAEDIACGKKDLKFGQRYCEELMAIAYVVPFQVLACRMAEHLGIDTSYFEMVHIGWPARD